MRPEPPSRVLIGRVSWLPVRQGGRERALWPPALLLCLCAAPPCWGTTAASPQTGLCSASPPKPDSAAKWCFRQSAKCSGEGGGRCPSCPWSLPLRAVWAAAAAAVPVCPGVQPPCWAAGPAGPGAEAASRCLQQGGLQVCHLCCSGRREHLHLGGESGPPSLLPDPRAPSGRALRRRQGVWSAVPRRGDQSLSTSGPVRRTDGGRSWPAAARALPEAPVPTARPLRRAPCAPRVRLGRSTASVLPQLEAAVPGGWGGRVLTGPPREGHRRDRSEGHGPVRAFSVTAAHLPVTSVGRGVKSGERPASPGVAPRRVSGPRGLAGEFQSPCVPAPPHRGSPRATRETGDPPPARQSAACCCHVRDRKRGQADLCSRASVQTGNRDRHGRRRGPCARGRRGRRLKRAPQKADSRTEPLSRGRAHRASRLCGRQAEATSLADQGSPHGEGDKSGRRRAERLRPGRRAGRAVGLHVLPSLPGALPPRGT